MRTLSGWCYRLVIKPILFLFPADHVHTLLLRWGRFLGKNRWSRVMISRLWRYEHPSLSRECDGLFFSNPIGLSAGFDYNADLVEILPAVGFGFHTIGTLTREAYEGNPRPMLGRLPRSKSLLVNKGFKNESIVTVLSRLSKKTGGAIRGVSIGATNKPYDSFDDMIKEIVGGFAQADEFDSFDYFELNISCPNLRNIQHLSPQIASPEGLSLLLQSLAMLTIRRPVYIKLPLERTHDELKMLVDVAVPFSFIKGLVISNLAKDRNNPHFDKQEIARAGIGNFSGKPTQQKANELISFARKTYRDRFTIIGVGGVFSAEDAYDKLKAGADLVQLITGMVYEGPQLIGQINKGLVRLMKRDGFSSVTLIKQRDSALTR